MTIRETSWKVVCVNCMMWVVIGCSGGGDSSTSFSVGQLDDVVGVVERIEPEQIQAVGHQAIDVYAALLKMKVDVVVKIWGSLSPAQRHTFLTGFVDVLKLGERKVEELLPLGEDGGQGQADAQHS